jgi:hypothetical protein
MDNKCGENVGRGFIMLIAMVERFCCKRCDADHCGLVRGGPGSNSGGSGFESLAGRRFFSEVFLHTQEANAATPTEVFS